VILFPAKRKLRKLAKSLVETHLQFVPWETARVWERGDWQIGESNKTGLVKSAEVMVNDLKLRVHLRYNTGWLEVYVFADGDYKYPGGMYTVYWLGNPWRWEWRLWRKVYHAEKGTKVTPVYSARDDLIENLIRGATRTPAAPSAGQLTLVPTSTEDKETA